ncbi:unnamed protein product, partial [Medioppia subpectinata]
MSYILYLQLIFAVCVNCYLLKPQFDGKDVTTDVFQLDCLQTHNYYREKHCSSPLKYSPKLKLFALKRATLLLSNVGTKAASFKNSAIGENTFIMRYDNSTPIDCKQVVQMWYKVKINYNWKQQTKARPSSRHFVQLVWNSTQRIGCATVYSPHIRFVSIVCAYHNVVPIGRNISD